MGKARQPVQGPAEPARGCDNNTEEAKKRPPTTIPRTAQMALFRTPQQLNTEGKDESAENFSNECSRG